MAEDRMLSDEVLLALIKKNSGGGGGGTDDYNDLKNQPKINNNTLVGNKTASDLGLVAAETGKGLSSNDYTNEDKAIVGGVTEALADKADKSAVKNEFIGTTAEWNALTTAQKKAYDTYQITDDYTEGSGGLPDYSTTEQKTGQKWIDGKDRYFITVDVGVLPNNNVKRVSCPLNIDTLIDIRGVTDKKRVLPHVYVASGYSEFIGVSYTSDDQIAISTNQDFSGESAYVTLWYTKTA